jgi:methylenetetrahydrofolate reductase (NADPH)
LRQSDLDNLKRKLDAGATRDHAVLFSPDSFLRFRDAAAAAGIDAPIIPGILPVSNVSQTRRMADMCGTAIPAWMVSLFDGLDDHPAARQLVSATIAAEMCRRLYAGGVRDFHFYTLNRAELSYAICHLLGLRPVATAKDQQHDFRSKDRCARRASGGREGAYSADRRRLGHADPAPQADRGLLCRQSGAVT